MSEQNEDIIEQPQIPSRIRTQRAILNLALSDLAAPHETIPALLPHVFESSDNPL